jgi:hypothetical protein
VAIPAAKIIAFLKSPHAFSRGLHHIRRPDPRVVEKLLENPEGIRSARWPG